MEHERVEQRQLGWWNENLTDEKPLLEGEVVEFTFGPEPKSYFTTSYPYRAENASRRKFRHMKQQNLPDVVLDAIEKYKPRYIMNLTIADEGMWFIYFYHKSRRHGYDSKWEPIKPDESSRLGEVLMGLRKKKRDQVSYCSFGPADDTFFIRSTDIDMKWYTHLGGKDVSTKLRLEYDEILSSGKLRAVTFGADGGWIVYGSKLFRWSDDGLPIDLVKALSLGSKNDWIINKAVLNWRNADEYVLVYDNGYVYYSFDDSFVDDFELVIQQWSVAKCEISGKPRKIRYNQRYADPEDIKKSVRQGDAQGNASRFRGYSKSSGGSSKKVLEEIDSEALYDTYASTDSHRDFPGLKNPVQGDNHWRRKTSTTDGPRNGIPRQSGENSAPTLGGEHGPQNAVNGHGDPSASSKTNLPTGKSPQSKREKLYRIIKPKSVKDDTDQPR